MKSRPREGMSSQARRGRRAGLVIVGAVAGALSLAACTPEPFVGSPRALSRGGAGTYTGLSQQLFVPRCASSSCHAGSPPMAFPQLDASAGWAAMVNVQSEQAVMKLVEPGAPDESWLMIRLRGEGGRQAMPPGEQLSAAEFAAVEGWILNGASND